MSTTETFLIAMLLIFALPYLVWRFGRTDFFAPLVVVQIIVGILLGPGVIGDLFPQYYAFVFNPQVTTALNGIAWWAVMIFVWLAGIELDASEAWRQRRETGVTAAFALVVPFLFGIAGAVLMFGWTDSWRGASGQEWQVVLGIGMSCAVTAVPVLILLMEKLEILRQPIGQRLLRYSSLDDIAIWAMLALILLDWGRVGRQAGFFLLMVPVVMAVRWLMVRIPDRDRWFAALIWLAVCGLAADWAGLHYVVGAFVAGAVLEARWFRHVDEFRNTILLTLMPVYFLSTGLRTEWGQGGGAVFAAAALLIVLSVIGKHFGTHIAGRILGWKKGEARYIGWLLQTKGLVMIVFANVLLDTGIISAEAFTALLLMAVASTMLTIPAVQSRFGRREESDRTDQSARRDSLQPAE